MQTSISMVYLIHQLTMYKKHKISCIISCYNEEEGIRETLKVIPSYIDEVIVVDNNSTDRTAEIAKKMGAKVVFEKKKGYGVSYKKGFTKVDGEIIAVLDGDGTYPSSKIAKLVDFIIENNLDFVSGCRFPLKDKKSMRRRNIIGNNILSFFFCFLYRHQIKDSQSGMWVFKKSLLNRLKLLSNGMSFSEEIKIEAISKGRFGECHIEYYERTGKTKLYPFKDGIKNLIFLFTKKFIRR